MSLLLLVIHLGLGAPQPLFVGLALYCRRKRLGTTSLDAAASETLDNTGFDHLADSAELFANGLGLPDKGLKDDVLRALHIDEVAAADALCWLQLAVDAPVSLLEPGGVPGQIKVKQVGTAHLQVDALASGIGADEHANGLLGRVSIEGLLQCFTALRAGCAGEDTDTVIGAV